jgi:hypothetical protein
MVKIVNQATIARSDRFTTIISCQGLAMRVLAIRVYDEAGNVIEPRGHTGDFR